MRRYTRERDKEGENRRERRGALQMCNKSVTNKTGI